MKRLRLLLPLFFLCGISAAGNHVFNGGFELGTDGWSLEKELRSDANPELKLRRLEATPQAAASGKCGLRLDNLQGENFVVWSAEFRLKPNTRYRFSGKVRADRPGIPIIAAITNMEPKWWVRVAEAKAGPEWQSFGCFFITKEEGEHYFLRIVSATPKNVAPAVLDFDDFRIEEADAPGAALSTVEAVLLPDKVLYALEADQMARFTVKAVNTGSRPVGSRLQVRGDDEYFKRRLFTREFPLKLAPGEKIELTFEEPVARCGTVRLSVEGEGVRGLDRMYTVIGKYAPEPFDILHDFVVGVNGGIKYRDAPYAPPPCSGVTDSDYGDEIRMLAKMGCRILRDHDSGMPAFGWRGMNRRPGEWDFSPAERLFALLKENHITPLPVLGKNFNEAPPLYIPSQPDYVNERSERKPTKYKDNILLPPMELWREYISRSAARFKGRIPVYEIINEPNIKIPAADYALYLETAFKAIRKADPAARVMGFSLSSDFSTVTGPWAKNCIELGGLEHCDIFSFHPYDSRTLDSPIAADRDIAALRSYFKARDRADFPLWNTELYFPFDTEETNDYKQGLYRPHHYARRIFTDLGEGVRQAILPHARSLYARLHRPNTMWNNQAQELIPNDNYAVVNAIARLFEKAKILEKRRPGGGVAAYLFERKGKRIAAVWNYRDFTGVKVDIGPLDALDLFGNPLEGKEFPVGEAPLYLVGETLSNEEFEKAFRDLRYTLTQTVSASPIVRIAGGKAFLSLYNRTDAAQEGEAGIAGGTASAPFRLAPHEAAAVAQPLGEPSGALHLAVGTGRWQVAPRFREVPYLANGGAIRLAGAKGDFSAEITPRVEGKILTIRLVVHDVTLSGPLGKREPWQGDGVELFFDEAEGVLGETNPGVYTEAVSRFFLNPYEENPLRLQSSRLKPEDCRVECVRSESGYEMTLRFPVRIRERFGFAVKVNDGDDQGGTRLKESLRWSGSPDAHRDRSVFGIVELNAPMEIPVTFQAGGAWKLTAPDGAEIELKAKQWGGSLAGTARLPAAGIYRLRFELSGTPPGRLLAELGKRTDGFLPGERAEYFLYYAAPGPEEVTLRFYSEPEAEGIRKLSHIRLERLPDLRHNLLADGGMESPQHPDWRKPEALKLRPDSAFGVGRSVLVLKKEARYLTRFLPVTPGKTFEFSFRARAAQPVRLLTAVSCWSPYGHRGKHLVFFRPFEIEPGWRNFRCRVTFPDSAAEHPDLADRMVALDFQLPPDSPEILLDDLRFTELE